MQSAMETDMVHDRVDQTNYKMKVGLTRYVGGKHEQTRNQELNNKVSKVQKLCQGANTISKYAQK